VRIDIGARTDVGRVREHNEDYFQIVPELNLFVLSDGIGGQEHGEVASDMAVKAIVEYCHQSLKDPSLPYEGEPRADFSEKTNRLASAIRRANRLIHEAAAADSALHGMGATVVGAWLDDRKLSLAHVGDSRAYRFRTESFEQLTRDHSLVAEQVRLGILTEEQAEHSEYQTMLMRALGAEENVDVDADEHLLMDGDSIMLCSDGLSRMVPDDAIAREIAISSSAQPTVDKLITMANEAGGADNITVILFRLDQHSPGFLERLLPWRNRSNQ
jgi:PPM family protein phosphatase